MEFLSLTLTGLIAELDHKGTVTREELREVMISVDQYDGVLDGRLPVAALEELLQPPFLEELKEPGERTSSMTKWRRPARLSLAMTAGQRTSSKWTSAQGLDGHSAPRTSG